VRWLALVGLLAPAVVLSAGSAQGGTVPASSGTFTMTSEPGDVIGQGKSYSFSANGRLDLGA
jgi:hypothetical protein